ncbi:hypothetical protein ACPT9H_17910 [Brevibacillus borstelensis]|uniref:hypothetical protein n=1 Tax=Brevibacillus borstelensis TaxID=45462 RepID=UPI003CE54B5C
MSFSSEERQRAIELGEKLGIKVTFGSSKPGIFVGNSDVPMCDFKDLFADFFKEHFELDIEVHQSEAVKIESYNIFQGDINDISKAA